MKYAVAVTISLLAFLPLLAEAKTLKITQGSTAADVVHYRAYWRAGSEPVTIADTSVDLPAGVMELDLMTVPEMAGMDGTYSFGVTAVDDSGLESTILQIGTAEIDHVPPGPPLAALIED
jgi:hypothetical protein